MDSHDAAAVTALTTLYQAERQETLGLLSMCISLSAAVMGYAAVVVSLFDKIAGARGATPLLAFVIPLPIWLGLLYVLFLVRLLAVHGAATNRLENDLHRLAFPTASQSERNGVGAWAGSLEMTPTSSAAGPFGLVQFAQHLFAFAVATALTGYVCAGLNGIWLAVTVTFYSAVGLFSLLVGVWLSMPPATGLREGKLILQERWNALRQRLFDPTPD